VENFKPQDTNDGRFYTFCVELNPKMRGIGFVSGMFVLMDKNYKEINYITLAANGDKNLPTARAISTTMNFCCSAKSIG
jgi:hypothetical protein